MLYHLSVTVSTLLYLFLLSHSTVGSQITPAPHYGNSTTGPDLIQRPAPTDIANSDDIDPIHNRLSGLKQDDAGDELPRRPIDEEGLPYSSMEGEECKSRWITQIEEHMKVIYATFYSF